MMRAAAVRRSRLFRVIVKVNFAKRRDILNAVAAFLKSDPTFRKPDLHKDR